MEKLLNIYIQNELSIENIEQWFQGRHDIINENDLDAQLFISYFIENLHLSFNWLLKQNKNNVVMTNNNNPLITSENLNIDDDDAFPPLNIQSQQQTFKKRIKPTSIDTNHSFIKTNENLFKCSNAKNNSISPKNSDYLKEEREMLKQFKMNMSINNRQKYDKIKQTRKIESENITAIVVEPKFDRISTTNKEMIRKLQQLYSLILIDNYWPYLFEEIKFIVEVISKKSVIESSSMITECDNNQVVCFDLRKLFESYHNCYYFGWLSFEEIVIKKHFFTCFNVNVIHHLIDDPFLFKFQESSFIRTVLNNFLTQKLPSLSLNFSSEGDNLFVSFQSETDGKQNFPDGYSFSMFRRQRDEFYRLFKRYNENSWSTIISTDKTIRSLFIVAIQNIFAMVRDVGNSFHLARLFVDQLLKSCNGQLYRDADSMKILNESLEQHRGIKINQDRLNKLQNRIIERKRQPENPLEPENLYSEYFRSNELFFRDFIYYSDSHSFNEQLRMILKSKLIEMTSCVHSTILAELCTPNDIKENLSNYLIKSDLLAKFAGFLSFYSLETRRKLDEESDASLFFKHQQTLRQINHSPLFDIETYLVNSMQTHSLLVSLPWVIEFLMFIDQFSFSMDCYANVFALLVLIYKYYLPNLENYRSKSTHVRIFLQLYLEKLFVNKKIDAFDRIRQLIRNNHQHPEDFPKKLFSKFVSDNQSSEVKNFFFLDFISPELLDSNLISYFFPWFSKSTLDILRHSSCRTEIRKITPTTLLHEKNSSSLFTKAALPKNEKAMNSLQIQIEECFFNLHTGSLRKCINFLNDRIQANCIKKIKKEIYPKANRKYFQNISPDDTNEIEIQKICDLIRDDCKNFIKKYSTNSIETMFPLLIAEDDLDQETIQFIIQQLCLPKIFRKCNEWIDTNVSNNLISNRHSHNADNLKDDLNKELPELESCLSKSRQILYDLTHEKLETFKHDYVIEILQQMTLMSSLNSFSTSNYQLFDAIILDLIMSIVTFAPSTFNDNILEIAINYWTTDHVTTHKRLICPKYLYMINLSKSPAASWSKWESFLQRMIRSSVYDFSTLEEDVMAVLKNEWPQPLLTRLASMLQSLVDFVEKNNLFRHSISFPSESHPINHPHVRTEIINWLAWICKNQNLEE
ncbi:Codanin 1 [Dermatophagoides pteronyssinus]|uniref:Codanin 1 n=1 Tax=Dermatophagoides pteronyssinus TaxID=6956 RepID=A0ABQ8J9T8_DERPT|nr:Codanin 1 [Dermatophagoides pteronyssinus]